MPGIPKMYGTASSFALSFGLYLYESACMETSTPVPCIDSSTPAAAVVVVAAAAGAGAGKGGIAAARATLPS